jgi:hypothetical protein
MAGLRAACEAHLATLGPCNAVTRSDAIALLKMWAEHDFVIDNVLDKCHLFVIQSAAVHAINATDPDLAAFERAVGVDPMALPSAFKGLGLHMVIFTGYHLTRHLPDFGEYRPKNNPFPRVHELLKLGAAIRRTPAQADELYRRHLADHGGIQPVVDDLPRLQYAVNYILVHGVVPVIDNLCDITLLECVAEGHSGLRGCAYYDMGSLAARLLRRVCRRDPSSRLASWVFVSVTRLLWDGDRLAWPDAGVAKDVRALVIRDVPGLFCNALNFHRTELWPTLFCALFKTLEDHDLSADVINFFALFLSKHAERTRDTTPYLVQITLDAIANCLHVPHEASETSTLNKLVAICNHH